MEGARARTRGGHDGWQRRKGRRGGMRRTLGCLILLASVMVTFAVITALLVGRSLNSGASINWLVVTLSLVAAFVGYCVGMVLLTALPSSDAPRERGAGKP